MPDHSDPTQQEQGASHILPPFFAPRARPRRATPTGAAAAGRIRLAPLFTPPGVGRQLGAAPASDEPSAADAAHGPEVESLSTAVPFAPEADIEAIAAHVAAPSDLPEPGVGESSFATSTPDLDVEFAGGGDDIELVLEANTEAAEHLVAQESGAWPTAVEDVDDAVLSPLGEAADASGDRLELEREEWLPGARSDSLVGVESFWAAEPTQPASDDFVDATLLEHAPDAEFAAAAPGEVDERTEPDEASLAMAPIDAAHTETVTDEYVEQPTTDVSSPSSELTVGDELTEALAWPTERPSQPADGLPEAHATPAEQALADAAPELRESAAPWAGQRAETVTGVEDGEWESAQQAGDIGTPAWLYAPSAAPKEPPHMADGEPSPSVLQEVPEPLAQAPEADADPELAVANALDRVARRIRDGELPLPTDAGAATDEGVLALVLAALLRGGPRG